MSLKIIEKILTKEIANNTFSPISKKIGQDLAATYSVVFNYIPIRPLVYFLYYFAEGLSPYSKKWVQNLSKKLGKKLFDIPNLVSPDCELTCKIFNSLEFKNLDNNLISDLLLEILAKNMDGNISDEKSDYIKYVYLINNLFPKSLVLLYQIYNYSMSISQENNYSYNYNNDTIVQGKEIKEDTLQTIQHYNFDKKKFICHSTRKLFYNKKEHTHNLKYINDLETNGLIVIQPLNNIPKPLYFPFNGKNYAYDNSSNYTGAFSLQVNTELEKYHPYLVCSNYQPVLTDLGKYLVLNFYSSAEIKKIIK